MTEKSTRVTDVELDEDTITLNLAMGVQFDTLPGQFVLLHVETDIAAGTGYYTIFSPTVDTISRLLSESALTASSLLGSRNTTWET